MHHDEEPSNGTLPAGQELEKALEAVVAAANTIPPAIRPRAREGSYPGGLIQLPPDKPCVLVPDVHARPDFIESLLLSVFPGIEGMLDTALAKGLATLVFLGDIPHAEGELAARRWNRAYERIVRAHDAHAILCPEMDEEMSLSLAALLAVIDVQCRNPSSVFCLKGNHDNMTNAADHGDLPFYKYADEGRMGALWLEMRYGEKIAHLIRRYELSLPVVACGPNFCASHAEPAFPLDEERIISFREHPEVVQALIWTANDEAKPGSVARSLEALLDSGEIAQHSVWFSGHRPVRDNFALRANGQLVQIHNPGLWHVVLLSPNAKQADFYDVQRSGGEAVHVCSLILDPERRRK
jgi:hypothetical protein